MEKSDYDSDFEAEVLSQCLRDKEYLKEASRILERHHFSIEPHSWIWGVVCDTWLKFREIPTPSVFLSRAKREFSDDDLLTVRLEAVKRVFELEAGTPRTSLDELRQFVRVADLQEAIEQSVKHMERHEWDEAYEPLQRLARRKASGGTYKISRWIEEFAKRQEERKHKKEHPEDYVCIPTGIKTLDRIIIGAQVGELCMVLGTTNRGKSIMLNHLGFQAISRGFNVVHFGLEMPAEQIAQRYDSRFTGYLYRSFKTFDFSKSDLESIDVKVAKYKARFAKKLRIVSMPLRSCDINVIKNVLDDLRPEMGKIDMVMIDSGDHMKSLEKQEQFRLAQTAVYWDLKDLGEDESLVVWTSTHAGREWETKTATTKAASEAYAKVQIADLVISLNDPPSMGRARVTSDIGEEAKPEDAVSLGDLDLFLAKARDAESKIHIPLDTDFKRMLIRESSGTR